jgi:hypothetical protein
VVVAGLLGTFLGCKPPYDPNASKTQEPAKPPEMEIVAAESGVGKKGQKLKDQEGILVTPIKALFAAEQRVVFEIQIPHAMQLYKAMHERAPKTHDEFMNEIIKANQIVLPELPVGNSYIYVPEMEQLMVQRPKS